MIASAIACAAATSASAAYVLPSMGGAMKHADISFVNGLIHVHVDDTVATPHLNPLTLPDEFDPTQAWSVLQNKAYNYQLAWNPDVSGGWIPAGLSVWVERIHHDAGLETYLRPMMYNGTQGPTWPAIFTADGEKWKWSGGMQHNAYAVLNPTQSTYSATYRVYVGDSTTGAEATQYGSDTVIWTWTATPVPEPASFLIPAAFAWLVRRRR